MRPLALRFSAFGSYAGEQLLDFAALRDRSFFLIHGPTGSGKTTILDAICFALYGETSGGEREIKQMRCELAEPSRPTAVTFDFALGGAHYRVTRQAEHERPKLRGEGVTKERAGATLWRLPSLGEDGDPAVLAAQWTRVTERVEEILGFRCEQFRQVVMLPQGQFRRLLLANSKERQQILEALFSTELYRRIEEALSEAARALSEQGQQLEQRRRLLLEQEEVTSEEELSNRRQQVATGLERSGEQIRGLQQREEQLLQRLTAARADQQRLEELLQARRALAALEARQETMEAAQTRAALARAAAGLTEVHRALLQRATEQRQAEEALAQAEQAQREARRALEQAQASLERERARDPDREAARRRCDALEAMRGRAQDLAEARAVLERAVEEASRGRAKAQAAREQVELSRGALEETTQRFDDARGRSAQLPGAREAVRHLERAVTLVRRLETSLADLAAARGAFEATQRELDQLEDELTGARQKLADLDQAWASGQAAVLAADLGEGAPCPVCGSTEHPALASTGHAVPSQATLSRRRKQVRAIEAQREGARQEVSRCNSEVIRLAAEVVTLKESLRLDPATDQGVAEPEDSTGITREVDRLERALADARCLRDAAAAAPAELVALDQQVQHLTDQARQLDAAHQEAERTANAADQRRAAQEALVDAKAEQVPPELQQPGRLEETFVLTCTELKQLTLARTRADERLHAASEALAGSQAAARGAADAAARARHQAEEANAGFEARLQSSGLRDEASFLAARQQPEELRTLEETIQRFRAELEAARGRRERAEEACADLCPPDLDLLERDLGRLKSDLAERLVKHGESEARARRAEASLDELGRLGRSAAAQDRRFQVLGRVAEVAAGNNSYRISFQRYVLAALLDDVLAAASRRLRVMSRGRYDLQRTRGQTDLRRSGGLDLLVFDSYTGGERPVSTLSGGESFLAALSLALGLADTVQAYAGGVKLETIFIDEGFGSLDPESFELAFRALVDLQGGGRRVGVISHLPELREQIDLCIEVRPGLGGSTARFV